MARTVKFDSTLRELLEQRGLKRDRSQLIRKLGVSSGALSHYLAGRSKPSFEVLIGLADFLDVSLDYLVYGEVHHAGAAAADLTPLTTYLQTMAFDLQSQSARHSVVVSRLGQRLSSWINDAASATLQEAGYSLAGMVTARESFLLESLSVDTWLLSMNLAYDLAPPESPFDDAPAMFTSMIADNIRRGRNYRFLLPNGFPDPDSAASRLRALVRKLGHLDELSRLQIGVSTEDHFNGVGLLSLDLSTLTHGQQLLIDQVGEYMTSDHWIGYTISNNMDFRGDILMSKEATSSARELFDRHWRACRRM